MSSLIVLGILLVAIIIWWSVGNHQRKRKAFFASEAMPADLRTARLVLSEQSLWCNQPVPLDGKPDQVYRTNDSQLIVVDSKRRKRARVYAKDRFQLSSYKVVLEGSRHKAVRGLVARDYGYIRFIVDGEISYVKVSLASADQVVALYHHYLAIIRGEVDPAGPASGRRACAGCDYRPVCPRR